MNIEGVSYKSYVEKLPGFWFVTTEIETYFSDKQLKGRDPPEIYRLSPDIKLNHAHRISVPSDWEFCCIDSTLVAGYPSHLRPRRPKIHACLIGVNTKKSDFLEILVGSPIEFDPFHGNMRTVPNYKNKGPIKYIPRQLILSQHNSS